MAHTIHPHKSPHMHQQSKINSTKNLPHHIEPLYVDDTDIIFQHGAEGTSSARHSLPHRLPQEKEEHRCSGWLAETGR
jgi:hypothetical protein